MRLQDDRPIVGTASARRRLAHVVLAHGRGRGLLAFGAADDHLHVELATDRATAGAFCRSVGGALRVRLQLAVPFEPARIRPLEDQRHAYNVFRYALRQDVRHGVNLDPAHEATSLVDLLGLRLIDDSLAGRVREHLPRVRLPELATALPTTVSAGGVDDLALLVEGAAAAFALPGLIGKQTDVVRARRAVVHAARGVPARTVGDVLSITARAVQRIRELGPDERAVHAVRRQADIRAALAAQAMSGGSPIPSGIGP